MEFPNKGNGQPPKKEPLKPVVSGAVPVSQPATRRLFRFIFAESPKNLGSEIGKNIVVPRLKLSFQEALEGFVNGMLWGGAVNRPGGMTRGPQFRGSVGPQTNYANITTLHPQQGQQQQLPPRVQSNGNYQDLVLPTVQDAENLLAGLVDQLNQYNATTVGDLYEMAGIGTVTSDSAFGWTNLNGARITQVREGFCLELPRPTLL